MTLTAEGTAQGLMPDAVRRKLVDAIRADHPEISADQADRIVTAIVAFLVTYAANPDAVMAPSKLVDIGWHVFVLHTRDYAEFCERVAGRFLHHEPRQWSPDGTGARVVADTVALMERAGLPVDGDLWPLTPADCANSCKAADCKPV